MSATAGAAASARPPLSMTQVLICGAAVVTLSMGIRHGFGLWLRPVTAERGWNRETFAFALAVQNLAWGLAGPFAGALALPRPSTRMKPARVASWTTVACARRGVRRVPPPRPGDRSGGPCPELLLSATGSPG